MVQRGVAPTEVTGLQKDIKKIFEQLSRLGGTEAGISLGEWFPRVDVFETSKDVVVKLEAPGLSKSDLSVSFRGPKMILAGEKKQSKINRSILSYLCLERSAGKFSRALYIDRAVDLTKAKAELSDGVLTVTMPKMRERRGSEFTLSIVDTESLTKK